ncbi:hypothetical protein PGT21_014911 [Puccinia graminis f. sp. tritici]|uniref:Uncharacterized protein n=1 Tax=Puccinia graminis f. sp. tritici TaxID=56615 RepID=A0A5B0PVU2_PUCGR|nr:hypothetical protein PGT21_014911 [Puccinia graminis f. sp. tritici]
MPLTNPPEFHPHPRHPAHFVTTGSMWESMPHHAMGTNDHEKFSNHLQLQHRSRGGQDYPQPQSYNQITRNHHLDDHRYNQTNIKTNNTRYESRTEQQVIGIYLKLNRSTKTHNIFNNSIDSRTENRTQIKEELD